jgi:hypothetical protein
VNTRTITPSAPAPTHHPLCVTHDAGEYDDCCNGRRWNLSPVWMPAADPGVVWIQPYRYAGRSDGADVWKAKPAQIELSIEGHVGTATAELTPGEARQIAAELLNAAEQAEAVA